MRNRRVSIFQSNPLWGPRRNLVVPLGMIATALIAVVNLYGPGLQRVFDTTPIPGMFWGIPFGFALGILMVDEVRKLLVRTYPNVSRRSCCGRGERDADDASGCSRSSRRWRGDICRTPRASVPALVPRSCLCGRGAVRPLILRCSC